jgi:FkbM family methyltransferase
MTTVISSKLESTGRVFRYLGAFGLIKCIFNIIRISLARALGRRFVVRRVHGYRMWLDIVDRGISRTLLLFGRREEDHKLIMEDTMTPGMTVLDIGANIGYYAIMESNLVGAGGTIIAVEPSPQNVRLLRRNIELNGADNIHVFECAVSDATSTRTFFLSEMSNLNTFHPGGATGTSDSMTEIQVETLSVDDLLARAGVEKVDYIRMDVEGHEVEVIRGLLDSIIAGRQAPMIILETHRDRYSKEHDFVTPLRKLFAAGYKVGYLASTSDQGSALVEAKGYVGGAAINTDFMHRRLFRDIAPDDAIELICSIGGVRTILLQPDNSAA